MLRIAKVIHFLRTNCDPGINLFSPSPLGDCARYKVANRHAKDMDILMFKFVVKMLVELSLFWS